MQTQPATSYDEVPYESFPIPQTHPDRLSTLARLAGVQTAPLETCRVLELGCAAGGNLVPMAVGLANAQFVGVDLSSVQVAQGDQLIRALGLSNIRLIAASVMDIDESFGRFDYIIAHGLYSWVPDAVQDKILEACSRNLAPSGVAFVSYNTLPGWRMRSVVRDAMRYRALQFPDARERVRQARAMLEFLARTVPPESNPYGGLLRAELDTLRDVPDYYILHEHLEDLNQPIHFHEFMARAGRHGLQYLADADLASAATMRFPAHVAEAVRAMAGDLIGREQLADFLVNRTFRQSLLVHAEQPLDRAITPQRVQGMWFASSARPTSAKPNLAEGVPEGFCTPAGLCANLPQAIMKSALLALASRWPAAMSFEELAAAARARLQAHGTTSPGTDHVQTLGAGLLQCFAADLVELHTRASPFSIEPGPRPLASPLARYQANRRASRISTLRHESIPVPDPILGLLSLLDGSRTAQEIFAAANTPGSAISGKFPSLTVLKDAIDQIARNALIVR